MLIYEVQSLPDLTLSKYQVFADSGVEGMLQAQTQFIRQLYRVALIGHIHVHFLFYYNKDYSVGKKLEIYLIFSGNEDSRTYEDKLRKIVKASNISEYFCLQEYTGKLNLEQKFSHMAVLGKKERFLQTVIQNEERFFYLVPNWKMNEEARLYSLLKLMQSFDETCCYRVDLYAEQDLEEEIHRNFERPLSYLRNLSNRDTGISEYSKLQKNKHDPNADETLRQYEDWLKAIDASSVYRCRVSAFASDEQYCQLLLDSALSESLESGNGRISVVTGDFSVKEQWNDKPEGSLYCSPEAPKTMRKWSSSFTVEEAAAFTRLPVLYDGETVELAKETSPVMGEEGILLGRDKNDYAVRISPKMLPKHMFVCGVPGSGKTNTMLHIANSLWNHEVVDKDGNRYKQQIPFLVLEPAKKEYRELALFDIPELVVFSPSACTNFPVKINPFEFAKGLTLSEHINKLCQVFEGAFPIAPPAPFILDRAIQAVYEKHGWRTSDINMGTREYPTMSELYAQFEKELQTTNYDSEIQGNIRSVLEMRIGSLLRREMKDIFDVPKSTLSPEEWLSHPVIIELEALGEGPANFVTLLLCTLIRETLKVNPYEDREKSVRHVIFIEEAHNLIAPESQVQDGQDSNPKIAATAFIVKMLAEVRALREGIIIADQLPTAMAPEVIKNTNIKMIHRLTSGDDRQLVGSTMSASPLQMENMATFTKGQALFTYEDLLRPFEMQVSKVEAHGEQTPDDAELYERLIAKKSVFYQLHKAEAEEKWLILQNEVGEILDKEKQAVDQLALFNFKNVQYEQLEKRLESCSNILNGILRMKRNYLYECSRIPERFIAKERKADLESIIQQIGVRYQEKIKQMIQLY